MNPWAKNKGKCVIHVYTSEGSCVASFIQITWKLWKKFESQMKLSKFNYLPWNNLDWGNPPSYSSTSRVLQLCKVSSLSVHLLRKSCANKTFGQMGTQTGWFLYISPNFICWSTKIHKSAIKGQFTGVSCKSSTFPVPVCQTSCRTTYLAFFW